MPEENICSAKRRRELLRKIKGLYRNDNPKLKRVLLIPVSLIADDHTFHLFDCGVHGVVGERSERRSTSVYLHQQVPELLLKSKRYLLLQENKHGSKRDIYYMHPSVFTEQTVVDRAINDICILLQCSRHNLNVQMAYDAKFLHVAGIHWLGAFPLDVDKYSLPKHCLLPLTTEDKRRTETLLDRCYLQREVPHWRLELQIMLQKGVKLEIEALSAHSLSFLSEQYIPSKIQTGPHI